MGDEMGITTVMAVALPLCAWALTACNSGNPSHPPVESSGFPGSGGGGAGPPTSTGGDASSGASAPEGGSCTPSSCPTGCCTSLDECEAQELDTACGTGGALCVACASGFTCLEGACQGTTL